MSIKSRLDKLETREVAATKPLYDGDIEGWTRSWIDDCVHSLNTGAPRNPPSPLTQARPFTKSEGESAKAASGWIDAVLHWR